MQKRIIAVIGVLIILLSVSLSVFAVSIPFEEYEGISNDNYTMCGMSGSYVFTNPANGGDRIRLHEGEGLQLCITGETSARIEYEYTTGATIEHPYNVFSEYCYTVFVCNGNAYFTGNRKQTKDQSYGACEPNTDVDNVVVEAQLDNEGYYSDVKIMDQGFYISAFSESSDYISMKPERNIIVSYTVNKFEFNEDLMQEAINNGLATSEFVSNMGGYDTTGEEWEEPNRLPSVTWNSDINNFRYSMEREYGTAFYNGSTAVHQVNHIRLIAFVLNTGKGTGYLSEGEHFAVRMKVTQSNGSVIQLGGVLLDDYLNTTLIEDHSYAFRLDAKELIKDFDSIGSGMGVFSIDITKASSSSGGGVSFGGNELGGNGTHSTYHSTYGSVINSWQFVFIADSLTTIEQGQDIPYEGYDGTDIIGGTSNIGLDISSISGLSNLITSSFDSISASITAVNGVVSSIFSFLPPEYLALILLALALAVVLALIRGLRGA